MKEQTWIRVVAGMLVVLALTTAAIVFATMGTQGDAQPTAVLKQGMSGTQVRTLQTKLNSLGFNCGKVDGIFGSKTTAAVKRYQSSKGLVADGIVGAKTAAALGISLSGSSSTNSSYNSSDVYLLAKCIYAEARGEPYTGQVAVGAVILNRVRSSKFPNTIAGVIYQPYAFTAVNDGQINLEPNQSAYNAARDCMNGWDPTNGCLYYYNPATATSAWIWSRPVLLKIGKHSFCK